MANPIGMLIPSKMNAHGMAWVTAWARDNGLQALDVPNNDPEPARAVLAAGLRIGTMGTRNQGHLMSPDDTRREQAVQALCEQIAGMPGQGAHVLFLCLVPDNPAQPITESLALFREAFPRIARACEVAEVRVAFEGWPGPARHYPTLGYTPEVLRAMFDAVPSPSLGICYDPSHLVRLGIDYLRVLDEFADRVHHCHGKDTELHPENHYRFGPLPPVLSHLVPFSGGAWRYCVPGDGVIDWSRVAYRLEQADYRGCVSIELEDARFHGSSEKEQQGIRKALRTLAPHFTDTTVAS